MFTPLFWETPCLSNMGDMGSLKTRRRKAMNHQRLKCYCILLDVAKKMPSLVQQLPRGEHFILDQLKRALASAILNLSEGNGRISRKERTRFFDISLASISEAGSAIDIINAYGYISQKTAEEIKSDLKPAYAMIRRLQRLC